MPLRKPAVSGSFYPSDPVELEALIRDCYYHALGPGRQPPAEVRGDRVAAVVSPHAGYVFSGPVAAHSYLHLSSLRSPELAIVIGPNHHGLGGGVSSWREGEWETPLGRMRVDSEASEELRRATGILDFDPLSHAWEHSVEVQLPFLQQVFGNQLKVLPICISFQDEGTTSLLAEGIAKVASGRRTLLVASSDLTHYEPSDAARSKDSALLEQVKALDVKSFYSTLERLEVTACGYGAIASVMGACAILGLTKGEVLKYANSGDTTKDYTSVVGYPSVRFL